MRAPRPVLRTLSLAVPALLLVLAACTDTKTVFVDREPFNPPPDQASGMLGYYTASTQQTTCGNCHVGTQAQWKKHGHREAYANLLAAVANPPASCYGCHTVSERGNRLGPVGNPAGWNARADSAYHDVQCESCHGPGLAHVEEPDNRANWPLARLDIKGVEAASCAACHSDTHHPFAEQWGASGHGNEELAAEEGGNPSCNGCHEGRAALVRFGGANSNYVEKAGTKMLPQTCAVCHDSHGSDNAGQLRLPLDAQEVASNLCTACHFRGTTPSGSFSNSTSTALRRGAHAAQGGVYFGQSAGWLPPGFIYDTNRVFSSHASPTSNPRLCAGCHVASYTINDPASGNFAFQSVGHLFQSIPCRDPAGLPTEDNSCDYSSTARFWNSCTGAGCHADANTAATIFANQRNNIRILVEELWTDDGGLNSGGEPYMSPATDAGLLPFILQNNLDDPVCTKTVGGVTSASKAFDNTDNCITAAEGALWNALMLAENLYSHNDGSKGVHNPFFYEALLSASIAHVRATYPGLPALRGDVARLMTQALSRPAVRQAPAIRQTASR